MNQLEDSTLEAYIDVEVEFLFADEGGRHGPTYLTERYRPHFRVPGTSEYLGVQFVEAPDRMIMPGERVAAKVRLIHYPDVSYHPLTKGTRFEILEGETIVGNGQGISDILYVCDDERGGAIS